MREDKFVPIRTLIIEQDKPLPRFQIFWGGKLVVGKLIYHSASGALVELPRDITISKRNWDGTRTEINTIKKERVVISAESPVIPTRKKK